MKSRALMSAVLVVLCVDAVYAACVDNHPVAAAASGGAVDTCQGLRELLGGFCSVHTATSQAIIAGGIADVPTLMYVFSQCPVTCSLCAADINCFDDDVTADAAINIQKIDCAGGVYANGGCDKMGAVFIQSAALGISPLQQDQFIESCPKSCGRCTAPPPCVDNDIAAKVIESSVVTCRQMVELNGRHCGISGAVFSGWTQLKVDAFALACPKACRVCMDSYECLDEDHLLGIPQSCEYLVGANAGTCSKTGPLFANAAALGFSPPMLDALIYKCAKSCGKCGWPPNRACKDDDAAVFSIIGEPDCKTVFQKNGQTCGFGPVSASYPGVSQAVFEGLMKTSCAKSCLYCKSGEPEIVKNPPQYLYFIEDEENPLPGGRYEVLNTTTRCNGNRVWKSDYYTAYIYTNTDGYWTAGMDPVPGRILNDTNSGDTNESLCQQFTEVLRAHDMHNFTVAPFGQDLQIKAGMDAAGKTLWTYGTKSRIQAKGCPSESQCLQQNCLEPPEKKTCADCKVDHALLKCDDDDEGASTVVVIIVVVVFVLIIACNIVYVGGRSGSAPGLARPMKQERKIRNKIAAVLVGYRRLWVHYMSLLGVCVAEYRISFFVSVMLILITFGACGLPLITVDTGSKKWVPEGGRLEREIDFVDKWTQDTTQSHVMIIMIGTDDDSSVLSRNYLESLLKVMQRLQTLTVPVYFRNGTTGSFAGYDDFCQSVDNPTLDTIMPGGKPCINPSVLDCFFEGSWQAGDVSLGMPLPVENQSIVYKNLEQAYYVAERIQPGQLGKYSGKPSFRNMTDQQIRERLSRSAEYCEHWIISATLSRSEAFGTFVEDGIPRGKFNETTLLSSKVMSSITAQYPAKRAREFRTQLRQYEERDIDDAMTRWYEVVQDALEEMDADDVGFPNTRITVYMTSSLEAMFSEIGKSRFLIMIIGWLLMTSYVLFTQFSMDREKNHCIVGFIGMLIVVISCLGGFGFIALVGITFNHTMIQMLPFLALGLGVDDMFMLLHYYKGIPDKGRTAHEVISDLYRGAGVSVTLTSFCNMLSFFTGTIIPIPALRAFLMGAGFLCIFNYSAMVLAFPAVLAWEADRDRKILENRTEDFKAEPLLRGFSIQKLVAKYYSPFMQRTVVKLAITGAHTLLFVILIITLSTVAPLDFGIDMADLTPEGSFLSKGFSDIDTHLRNQRLNHDLVVEDVDYPNTVNNWLGMIDAIKHTKYTSRDKVMESSWMLYFLYFAETSKKLVLLNPLAESPGTVSHPVYADYSINASDFYPLLFEWRDPASGLTAISAQLTDEFGYLYGMDNPHRENRIQMLTMEYSLDVSLLQSPKEWLDHTDEYHDLMASFMGEGRAYPHPSGMYLQMEEFTSLKKYFWVSVFAATAVIFASSIVVPVSLRGAALIAITSCQVVVEVAALLMIGNLSFSSLVAVALMVGMGLSVESAAHVVVGYEHATGTRNERLHISICNTFVPVCEGAISSILSFILLAFSVFPYVVKYFFLVFLVVILIGLLHGLIVLPALIGLVGSTDFIEEDDPAETKTDMKQIVPAESPPKMEKGENQDVE